MWLPSLVLYGKGEAANQFLVSLVEHAASFSLDHALIDLHNLSLASLLINSRATSYTMSLFAILARSMIDALIFMLLLSFHRSETFHGKVRTPLGETADVRAITLG